MIVIDASVAYKWSARDEINVDKAYSLLENHLQKKDHILIPELLFYELANAWSTKSQLPFEEIRINLQDIKQANLEVYAFSLEFIEKAILFSKTHHVSVYDASYAVLASEKGCTLITADEKFVKQVQLPYVTLLQ